MEMNKLYHVLIMEFFSIFLHFFIILSLSFETFRVTGRNEPVDNDKDNTILQV